MTVNVTVNLLFGHLGSLGAYYIGKSQAHKTVDVDRRSMDDGRDGQVALNNYNSGELYILLYDRATFIFDVITHTRTSRCTNLCILLVKSGLSEENASSNASLARSVYRAILECM